MNQREKILIGAAVAVAVALGVPMGVSALGSTQKVDQAVAKLDADRRSKERQAATLARQVKALAPQVSALAWAGSADDLRQQMVEKLSSIAQSSGMTLVTTRPLKPRSLDLMTEVSVELHLTGVLSDLVKFLYPLQQPNSRLTVDRVRLAATNADTDLLDVDVTVSGYTLQAPPEPKPTSGRRSA